MDLRRLAGCDVLCRRLVRRHVDRVLVVKTDVWEDRRSSRVALYCSGLFCLHSSDFWSKPMPTWTRVSVALFVAVGCLTRDVTFKRNVVKIKQVSTTRPICTPLCCGVEESCDSLDDAVYIIDCFGHRAMSILGERMLEERAE